MAEFISLRVAYDRLTDGGREGNAYNWYRRDAQRSGYISLGQGSQLTTSGPIRVTVHKAGRQWMVSESDFENALAERRSVAVELRQITEDYENRRLAVASGQVRTTWGGYSVSRDFHFVWNDMDAYRRRSSGHWRCNTCWKRAATEHEKPECHTCSDWGGCGSECTLSGIVCTDCGTRKDL